MKEFPLDLNRHNIFKWFFIAASFLLMFSFALGGILSGDLKLGFKLYLMVFFTLVSLIFFDEPRWMLILYVFTIPLSSAIFLFSSFYKTFSGFFIEMNNVFSMYNSLARPDGIYIYTIMELLIVFSMGFYFSTSIREIRFKRLFIFLFCFSVLSLFSVFTSINPARTLFQGFHLGLSLIVFWYSLQLWGNKKYDQLILLLVLFMILVVTVDVISFQAIKMLLRGSWVLRSVGRFNTPNPPAHLAGMGVIFSLYLFFKSKFPRNLFYSFLAIVYLLVIFCAGSRNALISVTISVTVFLFLNYGLKDKRQILLSVLLGIVLAYVGYKFGRTLVQLRLNPRLLYYDTSILTRFLMWENSIDYVIKNPFKPIGIGNFFYFYKSLALPFAHNLLINTWIESGLFPFLMLLGLYIAGLLKIAKVSIAALKGQIRDKDKLVSVAFMLYIILLFTADQFLYDGSLWRFMLILMSFAVYNLWGKKDEES